MPAALLLAGGVLGLCLGGRLEASLVAYENFESYAVGSVHGANGGTGWGGAWTGVASQTLVDTSAGSMGVVTAGGTVVDGGDRAIAFINNNIAAASRPLGLTLTEDVYVSFLISFAAGAIGVNDFVGLYFNTSTAPNIGLKSNSGGPGNTHDLFARTGGAGTETYSTDIVLGESYWVVGRLWKSDPAGNYNRFSLWVNPDTGDAGSPVGTTTDNGGINSVSSIGFRSVNLGGGDSIRFDEIRIGTTWDSVFPEQPVPEASTLWAGLGLLLALAGHVLLRRRRPVRDGRAR